MFTTRTTGKYASAPAAARPTVSVNPAARRSGITTAAAPAACAVRMIAPRLCGSSTPSKITCNPPDAAVSSIDEYFSAAPNPMTP